MSHADLIKLGRVIGVVLIYIRIADERIRIFLKIVVVGARERLASVDQRLELGDVVAIETFFASTLGNHLELAELFLQILSLRTLSLLLEFGIALEEVVKLFRMSLMVRVYFLIAHFYVGILLPVSV